MALIFDKINRVIVVEAPATEITIQELINAIRDWEDEFEAMDISSLANAAGKQDLGGGVQVGITLELINNWRVQFEDRPGSDYVACVVRGGNLVATNDFGNNPIKASAYTQVIIAQSTSATLAEVGVSSLTEEEHNHLMQNVARENTLSQISIKLDSTKGIVEKTRGKVETVYKIETGGWKIKNNQCVVYAPDNKTIIAKFNLFDKNGKPTEVNPSEMRRA